MKNLGPKSAEMLSEVGINSEADLKSIGAVDAFLKVREAGLKPSLNLLYAMEGALTGIKWNELTVEKRAKLDMKVNFHDEI